MIVINQEALNVYIMLLLILMLWLLAQRVVAHGVFQALKGEKVSLWQSVKHGLICLPSMLLASFAIVLIGLLFMIILSFAFVAALSFMGPARPVVAIIGTIAICLLGASLFLDYCLIIQACVAEKSGGLASFKRSADLVKNNKIKTFGIFLILFVILFIVSFISVLLIGIRPVSVLFDTLSGIFISGLGGVMLTVLYFELRVVKEGAALDRLVNVFD